MRKTQQQKRRAERNSTEQWAQPPGNRDMTGTQGKQTRSHHHAHKMQSHASQVRSHARDTDSQTLMPSSLRISSGGYGQLHKLDGCFVLAVRVVGHCDDGHDRQAVSAARAVVRRGVNGRFSCATFVDEHTGVALVSVVTATTWLGLCRGIAGRRHLLQRVEASARGRRLQLPALVLAPHHPHDDNGARAQHGANDGDGQRSWLTATVTGGQIP